MNILSIAISSNVSIIDHVDAYNNVNKMIRHLSVIRAHSNNFDYFILYSLINHFIQIVIYTKLSLYHHQPRYYHSNFLTLMSHQIVRYQFQKQ